jgi:hypothetical protein
MSKKLEVCENTYEVLQLLKNSRARSLRLPDACSERLDVMKLLADKRTIATLDLSNCPVRFFISV